MINTVFIIFLSMEIDVFFNNMNVSKLIFEH